MGGTRNIALARTTAVARGRTEMKELWVSRNATVYALVVLDVEKFRGSVDEMETLSEDVRRAIDERARDAFQDLDREVERGQRASRR